MNHVPIRWLRLLHIAYVSISSVVVLIFLALNAFGFTELLSTLGINGITASLAALHAAYGLVGYRFIVSRNAWLATFISQFIFDLLIAVTIQMTVAPAYYIWWGSWVIVVGLSAMLGYIVVLVSASLSLLLTLFSILGFLQGAPTPVSIDVLYGCGVLLSSLAGWQIFRRWYANPHTYTTDITRLSNALMKEQSQSGLIIQAIGDGVIAIDSEKKIQLFNNSAGNLTGWVADEASGIDINLVVKLIDDKGQAYDTDKNPFSRVFEEGVTIRDSAAMLSSRSGKSIAISLTVSPVIDPQNVVTGAVAIMRDISKERQEQQQRADFISTASHEMRTPVAAIEGYLSLALNDKVSTIDSRARSYLEKAHSSTRHLGELFQDLLTSAKAEDGRLTNHPRVVELGQFLEQLSEDLRFAAEKKGLVMEFVIGSASNIDASNTMVKPLYYVTVDPDRLREVITNLFDNGVKYTDEGKVTLGLTGDNDIAQVYVKDTGAGIPSDDIPHLFQKFYRVDNSATRTIGGTGLGLFICRKIIEMYNGRIWVDSQTGKGSTFYINLPRLTSEKAQALLKEEQLHGVV